MRVCFPFDKGPGIGGGHVSSVYLAEELMRLGIEVRFVVHKEEYFSKYLSKRGHDYDVLPNCKAVNNTDSFAGFLVTNIKVSPKIIKYINKNNIDIVHTNSRVIHRSWAIPVHLSKAKHILHAHGGASRKHLLDTWIARYCSAHLSVSNYIHKNLPPSIRSRSRVVNSPIYTTLPEQPIISQIRNEILQNNEGKIVGIFSRLDQPRKRVGFFARMARIIAMKSSENVQFLVCGRGSQHTIASIINEFGPYKNRLHIKGLITPVEPWMAACDCILAPAVREPLGRTPLEASAMNIPVVASNDGGHRESIINGVTGFLVNPNDIEVFCEKTLQVLQGALKTTESFHARKRLLQKFDPKFHAKLVWQIYLDLLKA